MTDDPILTSLRQIADARAEPTPFHDALEKGVVVDLDSSGVTAQGAVSLGHDMSVAGSAKKSFARRGWDWMVGFRWSPK